MTFLAPVSTYRPRKATALTDDELSALHTALTDLGSGKAVVVSREARDTTSKARTDAIAVRTQYAAVHGTELRTHVLGDEPEFVGAVSIPTATENGNGDTPAATNTPAPRRSKQNTDAE